MDESLESVYKASIKELSEMRKIQENALAQERQERQHEHRVAKLEQHKYNEERIKY